MWGTKHKREASLPSSASSAPFFPSVAPTPSVRFHSNATVTQVTKGPRGMGRKAVEEQLGMGEGFGSSGSGKEEKEQSTTPTRKHASPVPHPMANSSNVYPRSPKISPMGATPTKKTLQASQSTDSLRWLSHSPLNKHHGVPHSFSQASLHQTIDVIPGAHHFSAPPQALNNQPAPSNASAKLASRVDRWQSVEELLDHSQKVIESGGHYDPSGFNTFSSGSEITALTPETKKFKPRPTKSTTDIFRSPFSTTAPPPLPPPPPSAWYGSVQHATTGLLQAVHSSTVQKVMRRMDAKIQELQDAETVLEVNPSVLFAAGMTTSAAAGGGNRGSNLLASSSSSSPSNALQSHSAANRLWTQHQQMLAQARSVLPAALRSSTQEKVIEAIQALKPQTLLDILSPQAHILDVTLSELVAQLRKDSKEKALLLQHLVQHQKLVTDTLLQFVTVSCATLEGNEEEDDGLLTHAITADDDDSEDSPEAAEAAFHTITRAIEEANLHGGSASHAIDHTSLDGRMESTSLAALMSKPPSKAKWERSHQQQQDRRREAYEDDAEEDEAAGDQQYSSGGFDPNVPLQPSSTFADAQQDDPSDVLSSSPYDPSLLAHSSLLPASLLRFGNTHSWSLERWRNRAVARRRKEIQHEQVFLECLDVIAALSEIREKETALIGASKFQPHHRETYARIHGSHESTRLRLQARLDQLKLQLDPSYAGRFVRHHQMILELDQLERNVEAAVKAGDAHAAELAIQLSLLRQSGASHSTNKSASASATPGGIEHRLPNSIWLANSVPDSAMLSAAVEGAGDRFGSSSSNPEAASLRMRRLRRLVQIENRLALASEQSATLLNDLRSLQAEHLALQNWRLASESAAADTAALHSELTSRLEKDFAQEQARASTAETERAQARAEVLVRDVEIARLKSELAALGYSAKIVQDTYAKYVTNKASTQDAPIQTEEGVTGVSQGGWIDEYGTCPPPEPITVGVQLSEEELAALTVAALVQGAVAAQAQLSLAHGVSGAPSNEQTPGSSPVLSSQPPPSSAGIGGVGANASPKKTKRSGRMSSGGGKYGSALAAATGSVSSSPSPSTDASSRRSSRDLSIPNSPPRSTTTSGPSSTTASANRRSQSVGMGLLTEAATLDKARRAAAATGNESKSLGGNEQLLTLKEEAS